MTTAVDLAQHLSLFGVPFALVGLGGYLQATAGGWAGVILLLTGLGFMPAAYKHYYRRHWKPANGKRKRRRT